MAKIQLREDMIAGRYDGLPVGPTLLYSFETQKGLPVDAGNPLLRDLSPFTLRLIVPELIQQPSSVDVNLIGRANRSTVVDQAVANSARALFGIDNITGANSNAALGVLEGIVSAGQVVASASTNTERAVLTDATTAADAALQIERILQMPPLTLFVNPSEMSTSYSAVQQYSNRSRMGLLFERWGEGQITLSFSGSTGVFMASANPQNAFSGTNLKTESPSGAQFAARRDSAAFQNFTSLYHFYRNNGYIYDTVGGSEAHLMVGAIAIDYDQFTYVGHIESMDYSFQEGTPLRIEWSIEFTVGVMYDHADAPIAVLPMRSPQPSASYPGRPLQSITSRPDALSGGPAAKTTGPTSLSQTPLSLLIP